jgi:hypothetical protein
VEGLSVLGVLWGSPHWVLWGVVPGLLLVPTSLTIIARRDSPGRVRDILIEAVLLLATLNGAFWLQMTPTIWALLSGLVLAASLAILVLRDHTGPIRDLACGAFLALVTVQGAILCFAALIWLSYYGFEVT